MKDLRQIAGGATVLVWDWLRLTLALIFLKAARSVAPANVYSAAAHPEGPSYLLAVGYSHIAAGGTILATAKRLPAVFAEGEQVGA